MRIEWVSQNESYVGRSFSFPTAAKPVSVRAGRVVERHVLASGSSEFELGWYALPDKVLLLDEFRNSTRRRFLLTTSASVSARSTGMASCL
jgi:hypothetical protein